MEPLTFLIRKGTHTSLLSLMTYTKFTTYKASCVLAPFEQSHHR